MHVLQCMYYSAYRSLAKYCTTWARLWWEKYLESAEGFWVISPNIMAPSGTILSKATVRNGG
jgi:hypothetical protein